MVVDLGNDGRRGPPPDGVRDRSLDEGADGGVALLLLLVPFASPPDEESPKSMASIRTPWVD